MAKTNLSTQKTLQSNVPCEQKKCKPSAQSKKGTNTLRGFVLTKGNRHPIEKAGVFIQETRRGVYTDAKGYFVLHQIPSGKFTLVFKQIGFKPFWKKIVQTYNRKNTLYIYLSRDQNNPMESTLFRKRLQRSSQELSMNRKQMEAATGALGGDPLRTLQNFPGVSRASRVNGDLIVRGASFQDTGFYIDGHALPILYHFGAGLTVINRRFLERIDFYPGGAPLSFGRFTAGLVSVQSRELAKRKSVHGEAYLSFSGVGFFLEAGLPKGWSVAAAMNRSYVDAFFSLFTQDPLQGHFWDYQLKIDWHKHSHQVSFFLLGSDDILDYSGKKQGPEVPVIGREKNKIVLRFLRFISSYRYKKGAFQFKTSLACGFNQDDQEPGSTIDRQRDLPIELRIDTRFQIQPQLTLNAGVDATFNLHLFDKKIPKYDPLIFPTPSPRISILQRQFRSTSLAPAVYVALRWQPHPRFLLQPGIRADLFVFEQRPIGSIDPRISSHFLLTSHLRLLLSAGLFHQPPQPEEWTRQLGNPSLSLEQALQVAGGFEYQPSPSFKLRIQGYSSSMSNQRNLPTRTFEQEAQTKPDMLTNQGIGRAFGLECLAQFRYAKKFRGWISYTLSRSERASQKGQNFSLFEYDQPHMLNFMLAWTLGKGWSFHTRFRLASGNPTSPVERTTYDADQDDYRPVLNQSNLERLPFFHQLDLRIDKRWVFSQWTLTFYLDIHNAYNAKNTEEFRYNYNYTRRIPVNGLPFFPAFGIRGQF